LEFFLVNISVYVRGLLLRLPLLLFITVQLLFAIGTARTKGGAKTGTRSIALRQSNVETGTRSTAIRQSAVCELFMVGCGCGDGLFTSIPILQTSELFNINILQSLLLILNRLAVLFDGWVFPIEVEVEVEVEVAVAVAVAAEFLQFAKSSVYGCGRGRSALPSSLTLLVGLRLRCWYIRHASCTDTGARNRNTEEEAEAERCSGTNSNSLPDHFFGN